MAADCPATTAGERAFLAHLAATPLALPAANRGACVRCGETTVCRDGHGRWCHPSNRAGGCWRPAPEPCAYCGRPTRGRDDDNDPACREGYGCTVRRAP